MKKYHSCLLRQTRRGFPGTAAAGLVLGAAIAPSSLPAYWLYSDAQTLVIDSATSLTALDNGAESNRISGDTNATVVHVIGGGVLDLDSSSLSVGGVPSPSASQYGELRITGGGVVSGGVGSFGTSLYIGANPSASYATEGLVTVSGAGSILSLYGTVHIGSSSRDSLATVRISVRDGGVFEVLCDIPSGTIPGQYYGTISYNNPLLPPLPPRPEPIGAMAGVGSGIAALSTSLLTSSISSDTWGTRLSGYAEVYHSKTSSYVEIGSASGDAGTVTSIGAGRIHVRDSIVLNSNSTFVKVLVSDSVVSGSRKGGLTVADGNLTIANGATLDVQLDAGYSVLGTEAFSLAQFTGSLIKDEGFNGGDTQLALGGYLYNIIYGTTDIQLVGTGTPIPEPSTYALLGGIGAVALALLRRRRKG